MFILFSRPEFVPQSYHDSCKQAHPLATVGVRDHVAVANGQEGDGDQPHCSKKGTGHLLCIMIPGEKTNLVVTAGDASPKH